MTATDTGTGTATALGTGDPYADEPYGNELFLAALSGTPVLLSGLDTTGITEDLTENSDAPETNIWQAGHTTYTATYAFARRFKPFLTFRQTATITAYLPRDFTGGTPINRRDYPALLAVVENWETTPLAERPVRFPDGGPEARLLYAVRVARTWLVHGHAHTPDRGPAHYAIHTYQGHIHRQGERRVQNLRTLDDAWAYARHATVTVNPTETDTLGMPEAIAHFCPTLR